MTVAERITRWLAELRGASQASWIARAATAVAGAVALVVPGLQPWDQMPLIPIVGTAMLLVAVVLPDSAAALVFLALVAGGWVVRAPADLTWALVVTAIALLVVHLATAFAGQLPSYGRAGRRALRRWVLPATIAALLAPVVAIAAALVRGADVPGSLLVTVGALIGATAAVWFASGQSLSEN
jgi:hypothetical protein